MSEPSVKIPALNPLRFHKVGGGDWWQNLLPPMEAQNARYCQKMQSGDRMTVQFGLKSVDTSGTVYLPKARLVDQYGETVKEFTVSQPPTMPVVDGYYMHYVNADLPTVTDGVYYVKLIIYYPYGDPRTTMVEMIFYSEPIWVKTHDNTVLITYSHSENEFDCVFTDAAVGAFCMRIEGGVRSEGFTPGGKYEIFSDLDFEPVMLEGTPYNTYKWSFGPGGGVPNFIADKLNRIFACDTVTINGVGWMRGDNSKIEGQREQNWPFGGWTIDLVKTEKETSEGFDLQAFTVDITATTCDSTLITCDKTLV